jgi:hypothetical protein
MPSDNGQRRRARLKDFVLKRLTCLRWSCYLVQVGADTLCRRNSDGMLYPLTPRRKSNRYFFFCGQQL